ncbi:murein biosynthesis integral membrane protein MurJ [Aquirhabdus parva]|uniref:Probable lipid II flippase MurJ n=1 Tax=Aquirhabdus parva TaxID=2283318 RepID=A0A345P348_9GAMM|nr:murein biosynthesis integral membrane protein MurJ [Aquirhabdus parva]AXI01707.1 murein biosynthesis integral membrane protein MurJ [Aquirhabdus parva]
MARSLWRSTFIVSAMTMLSRILGLVRDMVLLNVFGAGGVMDAFLVAFKIPNFLRRLFAEGAFSQAFVPVLSEYKTTRTHEEVQILISRASGSLMLILGVLTTFAVVASPLVIFIFAPGFHGQEVKFQLAVELLRLTFPYLLLISMTAFAGSVLNSYGSFATASFAPVLLNVTMIAAAWWLAPLMSVPVMALGWGVMAAGFIQLAIQIPELWKKKLLIPPKVDFKHEGVVRILKLMLPALFGVSVVQINLLLDTVLASFMKEGSVSWLYTAERMTELPLGLIGIAIATVILPSLSAIHAEKDHDRFKRMLDWATQVIALVGIPASLAMILLAEPMIQALFQHGRFGQADVDMTVWALRGLSGGILAFMLIKIFAPGFYARQDTKTPVKIGLIAVVANMVFNLILVGIFHLLQWPLHAALSLASTASAFLNAGLLYRALARDGVYRIESHWKVIGFRYLCGNVLMAVVLVGGLQFYQHDAPQLQRIAELASLCLLGATAYGVGLLLTGFRPSQIRHH